MTEDRPPKILSVGQCGFDGPAIKRQLRDGLNASVVDADGHDDALAVLGTQDFDLVLVNRIFDGTGEPGLDLIREVAGRGGPPVMMVSNYDDAQAAAEQAGGVRGFGKKQLGSPAVVEAVRSALPAG